MLNNYAILPAITSCDEVDSFLEAIAPSIVHILAALRAFAPALSSSVRALPLGVLLGQLTFRQLSVGRTIVMVIAEGFFGGAGFAVEKKTGHQGRKENLGNGAHSDCLGRKVMGNKIGTVTVLISRITMARSHLVTVFEQNPGPRWLRSNDSFRHIIFDSHLLAVCDVELDRVAVHVCVDSREILPARVGQL